MEALTLTVFPVFQDFISMLIPARLALCLTVSPALMFLLVWNVKLASIYKLPMILALVAQFLLLTVSGAQNQNAHFASRDLF